MNIYFIAIITILIFEYTLSFIVRTLNLSALDPNLPEEFKDTFQKQFYTSVKFLTPPPLLVWSAKQEGK